jgi:hypothetical protein
MKHLITAFCCFILIHASAAAQTAEDSVRAVITRMFDAMRNSDSVALREIMWDSARIESVAVNASGETVIRGVSGSEFISRMGKLARGTADERVVFENVRTDGPMGFAWTPYRFYYSGAFSHCGVNSFRLARFSGRWKIVSVLDTRRKSPCPE